eukprot:SM000001S04417  [mRNA]  locus=s1:83627:85198:- [translate_table: standard]
MCYMLADGEDEDADGEEDTAPPSEDEEAVEAACSMEGSDWQPAKRIKTDAIDGERCAAHSDSLLPGARPSSGSEAAGSTRRSSLALSQQLRDLQACCRNIKVEVKLVDDNLYLWEAKLGGFPPDSKLHDDLLRTQDGVITLRLAFSHHFPDHPPFTRVVFPRFKLHTGHVSNGGAICLEMLTLSGWTPAMTVEGLLVSIRAAMVEANGRLETNNDIEYKEENALQGYKQIAVGHRWKPVPL